MHYPLLLVLLLSLTGCPKRKDPYPELVRVAFVVPARIEPGGDVLALGDTLWLDLDASDSVLFEPVYDAGRQRHRARVGMVAREWGGLVVR